MFEAHDIHSFLCISIIFFASFLVIMTLLFQPVIAQNPGLLIYENHTKGIKLLYPADWKELDLNNTVIFYMPKENNSKLFQGYIAIEIIPSSIVPTNQSAYYIAQLESLHGILANYKSTNADSTLLGDYPASKKLFTATKERYDLRGMTDIITVGNKFFVFEYVSEVSRYYFYLPTAQGMINSFVKFSTQNFANPLLAGLKVGTYPAHIAVNPITNKIYVTNQDSFTVSVIDGSRDRVVDNILVGRGPVGIAVNPDINRIYVANFANNTVSVINGDTQSVIRTIKVGPEPISLASGKTSTHM